MSLVVLAEVSSVLATAYAWDRATNHARVSQLIRTTGVVVEELDLVQQALAQYAGGKADLADYLILGKARSAAGRALLTFDRKLARAADVTLL